MTTYVKNARRNRRRDRGKGVKVTYASRYRQRSASGIIVPDTSRIHDRHEAFTINGVAGLNIDNGDSHYLALLSGCN